MTRLSIDIPDELRAKLEARAAETGDETIERYVERLIRDDAEGIDHGAPEHLRAKSRQHLEELLAEGLESPARQMTADDFDAMRRKLAERNRQSKDG